MAWQFGGFLFDGAPYLGPAATLRRIVVEAGDELFHRIASDPGFDDRRGHLPAFTRSPAAQLSLHPDAEGLARYTAALAAYEPLRMAGDRSDVLAGRIGSLVHALFQGNTKSERAVDDAVFAVERHYRAEDFAYFLASARTACGTVGEATVTLLRGAGFRARLVRIADNPAAVAASHVLAEYYSGQSKRWRLIDPMIDAVGAGSLFETLGDARAAAALNERWGSEVYGPAKVGWFDRRGPVMDIYYHCPAAEAAQVLRRHLDI